MLVDAAKRPYVKRFNHLAAAVLVFRRSEW